MIKNLHKNSLLCVASVLIIATFSVGCKKKEPQPPVAATVVKPSPQQLKPIQKAVSSALKLPPAPVNQFDFSNKKDPFKPFAIIKPQMSKDIERKAAKEGLPILSFDVNQFKLIGIVTGDKENKAMVTDPSGKGYVLKVGMTIGKNEGRITAITTNGVDVLEQFRDDNGRVRKEYIRITLPRKQ
ncbi:MAG TPA: pilus assembly protein PilP [Desulfuromonadaceae bacterium]|jgi:type IV pilus assembly protein PilP